MANFFSYQAEKKIILKIKEPEVEMSIIKRLGKPKFWVSNNDFFSVMQKIYKNVSKNSREIYFGANRNQNGRKSSSIFR